MNSVKIKALTLAVGLALGSSNANAFYNQTVEPEMGSVDSSDYMNDSVQPVTTPVTPVKKTGESGSQEDINKKIREEAEKAEREARLERERIEQQIREEARKEQLEKERLQREIRLQAEREKAEKERAERDARRAAQRAKQEAAQRKSDELESMRKKANDFVAGLDLSQYDDRVKYMRFHNKAIDLAGDESHRHVQDIKTLGSQAYHKLALKTVQEGGRHLFKDKNEAVSWGNRTIGQQQMAKAGKFYGFSDAETFGRDIAALADTWPGMIDDAQDYLDLATKYVSTKFSTGADLPRLQEYLDWRKDQLDQVMIDIDTYVSSEDFDPDKKIGGGITVGDVAELASDVTKKGWNKTKETTKGFVNGVKNLKLW